jgi:hypothetical protein
MLCNTLHLGLASACAVSNESDSTEALVMVVCLFVSFGRNYGPNLLVA